VKIYTKTGDKGGTSLFSGGRVSKDSSRIEAYGTVDELNSLLGLLTAEELPSEMSERLREIQGSLFAIGSLLADPKGKLGDEAGSFSPGTLEGWIDTMDSELPELRAFILPGGCREAALAHVARSVCRRAERRVVAVDGFDSVVVAYLNRLSDLFFVLARWLNARGGIPDVEWRP